MINNELIKIAISGSPCVGKSEVLSNILEYLAYPPKNILEKIVLNKDEKFEIAHEVGVLRNFRIWVGGKIVAYREVNTLTGNERSFEITYGEDKSLCYPRFNNKTHFYFEIIRNYNSHKDYQSIFDEFSKQTPFNYINQPEPYYLKFNKRGLK